MEKVKHNSEIGKDAELLALDMLNEMGFNTEKGIGAYGKPDIWIIAEEHKLHCEVKHLTLNFSKPTTGLLKISLSQYNALMSSIYNDIRAFILILVKTKSKISPMVWFAEDIQEKCYHSDGVHLIMTFTFLEIFPYLVPLKYLDLFLGF